MSYPGGLRRGIQMKRLLDLFCGAGGSATGYHRAGFEVVGVDITPQLHFPFEFHQADALTYNLAGFDVIHASPPCQLYSACRRMHNCKGRTYTDLIAATRSLLLKSGAIYVIENVKGSPLINPNKLTGTMFGLKMHRERWFESNVFFFTPEHRGLAGGRVGKNGFVSMVGGGDTGRGRIPADHRDKAAWQKASGIDWMTKREMSQSVPPEYTEYIGRQLMDILTRCATANHPATEKGKETKPPQEGKERGKESI